MGYNPTAWYSTSCIAFPALREETGTSCRTGLINARSALDQTRIQLLNLLSPKGTNTFQRDCSLLDQPATPPTVLDDVSTHVAVAMRMRPDLNETRLAIQRGILEVVKTRNGLLPRLDLFIMLGSSGYADSFRTSSRHVNGDFHDASAGFAFAYPFGNNDAQAQYQRAQLSRDQASEILANMQQLAEVDVRLAYVEIGRAHEEDAATAVLRQATGGHGEVRDREAQDRQVNHSTGRADSERFARQPDSADRGHRKLPEIVRGTLPKRGLPPRTPRNLRPRPRSGPFHPLSLSGPDGRDAGHHRIRWKSTTQSAWGRSMSKSGEEIGDQRMRMKAVVLTGVCRDSVPALSPRRKTTHTLRIGRQYAKDCRTRVRSVCCRSGDKTP